MMKERLKESAKQVQESNLLPKYPLRAFLDAVGFDESSMVDDDDYDVSTVLDGTSEAEKYLLLDEGSDPDEAWNEIRLVASAVISKICKNFCPCSSQATYYFSYGTCDYAFPFFDIDVGP
ncbi:hypothetical protein M5K25_021180 [Dendrobium thyrsiflorum]|uniref:Uncharacterized protein n=1 Tax=Dendrobium thyrsiflorum TaxID=117978 RepID=A0ABD0UBZ5_DENTH